jgi:hypothetical protein
MRIVPAAAWALAMLQAALLVVGVQLERAGTRLAAVLNGSLR